MLNLKLREEIKQHALRDIPNECCGLIIHRENNYEYFPCRNISYVKTGMAIVDPFDYIRASESGKIVGHIHSQPHDEPSFMDNLTAKYHNIYSVIYTWENNKFYIIEPKLKDYLNHEFYIGTYDCFKLVRDYYKQELNIEISDYTRDALWFKKNPRIIYENFQNEGFREIYGYENLKENDILLFGKDKEEINHMGIYLRNDLILHHPRKMRSVIEYLNEHYKKDIVMVVRHKNYG